MGIVGMDDTAVLVQRRAGRGEVRRPVRRIRAEAGSPRRPERALYVVPDLVEAPPGRQSAGGSPGRQSAEVLSGRQPQEGVRPARRADEQAVRLVPVSSSPAARAELVRVERVLAEGLAVSARSGRAVSVRARTARPVPVRRSRGNERYAPVRLTRRGKIVAQSVLILVAVFTVLGIAASTRASVDAPSSGPRPTVVVHSGDTLWNIAERYAPGMAPRDAMAEIRRLNDLDSSVVEVGQRLELPRG